MNDFIPECLDRHIFKIVSQTAEELGVRAFVIGGFVRDYYLHRPSNDIDIVVEGSGLELAEAVGRKVHARVTTFRNFGTAMKWSLWVQGKNPTTAFRVSLQLKTGHLRMTSGGVISL